MTAWGCLVWATAARLTIAPRRQQSRWKERRGSAPARPRNKVPGRGRPDTDATARTCLRASNHKRGLPGLVPSPKRGAAVSGVFFSSDHKRPSEHLQPVPSLYPTKGAVAPPRPASGVANAPLGVANGFFLRLRPPARQSVPRSRSILPVGGAEFP